MPVVGSADAWEDVPQRSLRVVARHPGAGHQGPSGAPEVVQGPPCDTAGFIESPLEFTEPADRCRLRVEGLFWRRQ
jgi:hypothetical protein